MRAWGAAAGTALVRDTSYGGLEPLAPLAEAEPSAPHGLHPGLGVQAAAVQQ